MLNSHCYAKSLLSGYEEPGAREAALAMVEEETRRYRPTRWDAFALKDDVYIGHHVVLPVMT